MSVALLLLLLVLPCTRSYTPSTQVIACDEGQDVLYFDRQQKKFQKSPMSVLGCPLEEIGRLCRAHYNTTSYGTPLSNSWTVESRPRHLFECRELHRAVEPAVPEGSWSDSLISVNYNCLSKEKFLDVAERECTRPIRDISFGGQCENAETFMEAVFTCDAPARDIYRSDRRELPHFQHRQIEALRTYAHYNEQRMKAQALGDREAFAIMSKIMRETLDEVHFETQHINVSGRDEDAPYLNRFHSRRRLMNILKWRLTYSELTRTSALLQLAAHLLVGNEGEFKRVFHRESIRCDEVDFVSLDAGRSWFPETRFMVKALFVDYCRNHTLGIQREHLEFLAEYDGVDRLMAMYKEIFRNGTISMKYLSKSQDVPGIFVGLAAKDRIKKDVLDESVKQCSV
ncbi:hypothetical protein QR680_010778 [Steinernema hermaphroditum]|uniref:Uncharacterized protein n=1 Tax=Steinernema hermaphroditum TaxID=289476 RepID=A0AA39IRI0_9BILA|nr:hypothetical protein QR680_010778 [Steinernema hermaphroditum]